MACFTSKSFQCLRFSVPQVVGHTTSITTVSFVTEGKKSIIVCQSVRFGEFLFVRQARIQKTADCENIRH